MGNFNRPSENIVFQMEQINICKADISVVSERQSLHPASPMHR